jgi:hypothetical protein
MNMCMLLQSEWTYHGPSVCNEVVEPEGEGIEQQLRREDSREAVVENVQRLERCISYILMREYAIASLLLLSATNSE